MNLRRLAKDEVKAILYRSTTEGLREELVEPDPSEIRDSIILCGSFNPLHEGHIKLAQQAAFQAGV